MAKKKKPVVVSKLVEGLKKRKVPGKVGDQHTDVRITMDNKVIIQVPEKGS